ncbi:MAG: CDP-glycerol glycerophosphotransferase family protein [Desulfovibrio sp.]|nr:CDP-glycerol glycerophosphotransferase family protein [Desulfovibrio sp.]
MDPLKHYQTHGCREAGRYPNLDEELDHEFDAAWYAQRYADVTPSGLDPREHYTAYGFDLGRYTHAAAEKADAETLAERQTFLDDSRFDTNANTLPTIAVHLHVGTTGQLPQVYALLGNVSAPFDLYCSYGPGVNAQKLVREVKTLSSRLPSLGSCKVCEGVMNRLEALFLRLFDTLVTYTAVCHLHTDPLSFPCEGLYNLRELLSPQERVARTINCLARDDTGMIYPEPYFHHTKTYISPTYCETLPVWRWLATLFSLPRVPEGTLFCAGGMFWCRGDTLCQAFGEEGRRTDVPCAGQDSPASQPWERLLCYVPLSRGKRNWLLRGAATQALRAPDTRAAQDRVYDAILDREWYLRRYPDLAASNVDPAEHFRRHGREENRRPCAAFPDAFLRFQWRTRPNMPADETDETDLRYLRAHYDAARDFVFANIPPRDFHALDGTALGYLPAPDVHIAKSLVARGKGLTFSILVLLNDAEDTAALQSCSAQTATNVEIIVIDASGKGVSPGAEPQCLSGRVRVVPCPADRLLVTACTQAVSAATGNYILFLHGRDRLSPDFCACMGGLAEHYGVDAVMCDALTGGDALPPATLCLGLSRHVADSSDLDFTRRVPFAFSGLTAKIFRRSTWLAAHMACPGRRDGLFDDVALLTRFARQAKAILRVEHAGYCRGTPRQRQAHGVFRDALLAARALQTACNAERLPAYVHALLVHRIFALLRRLCQDKPRYARSCLKRLAALLDAHATAFTPRQWNDLRRIAGEICEASLATTAVRDRLLFVDPVGIAQIRTDFLEYWKRHFAAVEFDYVQCAPGVPLREFLRSIELGCTCTLVVTSGAWSTESEFRTNRPIVQLWHGIGLGKNVPPLPAYMRPRLAFCSGEGCREDYARLYRAPRSAVLPYGSIVTDRLLDKNALRRNAEKLLATFPEWRGKTIYLWCPTFRGVAPHLTQRDRPSLAELSRQLREDEVLLVKYHPALRPYGALPDEPMPPRLADVSDRDLIELLSVVDVFMTDFSTSISYAMLLNKKICCLISDLHELNARHGLLVDFATWRIPVIENAEPQAMLDCLRSTQASPSAYAAYREAYLSGCDGHSVPRIARAIHDEYYDEYLAQSLRPRNLGVAA